MSDPSYPPSQRELPDELTKTIASIAQLKAPAEAVVRLQQSERRRSTRRALLKRWQSVAFAVAAAAILACVSLLPMRSNTALADMHQAMSKISTIQLVARMIDNEGQVVRVMKGSVLTPSRIRHENADFVVVADFEKGQAVEVDATNKTARIYPLHQADASLNLLGEILDIMQGKRQARATKVDQTDFDGVSSILYHVQSGDARAEVLMNGETKLPLKISVPMGNSGYRIEASEFGFDQPLDDALFAIEAPAGYDVTTVANLPADDSQLVLAHGVGLGAVKLGSTVAEVIERFGAPDVLSPGDATTRQKDVLFYKARGFQLQVSPSQGVTIIACSSGSTLEGTRRFAGAFKKGNSGPIRLGDAYGKVVQQIGEPTRMENFNKQTKTGSLIYDSPNAPFTSSLSFANAKLQSVAILKQ